MSIKQSIELSWGDESMTFTPTMDDIDAIEKDGFLFEAAMASTTGKPRTVLVSKVLSSVFELGGIKVSPEEVRREFLSSPDAKIAIIEIINGIVAIVWPTQKKSGEPSKIKLKS